MASGLGRDLVVFFRTAYKHEYNTAETCVLFFQQYNPYIETDETGHSVIRRAARVSMVLHQPELG